MPYTRLPAAACLTAGLVLLAPPALAAAGDGQLDSAWGDSGRHVVEPPSPGASLQGTEVASQGAGFVVATTSSTFDPETGEADADLLVRHVDANGRPDGAFGTDGVTLVDVGADAYLTDLAVLPDQSVLLLAAVGGPGLEDRQVGVVRLSASGVPDPAFGSGGVVVTDLRAQGLSPRALLPQRDGGVLVGLDQDGRGTSDFAVARYDGSGGLDPSYGTGGLRLTDLGGDDHLADLVDGPGGEVLAVGYSAGRAGQQAAVTRLLADGSRDTTFGRRGVLLAAPRGRDVSVSTATLTGQGLVVAGAAHDASSGEAGYLAAVTVQGRLDSRFGSRGQLLLDDPAQPSEGASVATAGDGALLVSRRLGDGPFLASLEKREATSGALVPGFGAGGRVDLGELAVTDLRADRSGLLVAGSEFAPDGPVAVVQRRR